MSGIFSRMSWFIVLAVVISYPAYLVAGNIAHAQASKQNEPVLVRDELGTGVHHLSGMIMVPSSCDQLSVRTESSSKAVYRLIFRTWRDPSVECLPDEMP